MNPSPFAYIGGHSLVDLVNTLIQVNGAPFDLMTEIEDVRVWATGAGLIPADANLLELKNGSRWLKEVRSFRKKMRTMLGEIRLEGGASAKSLEAINKHLTPGKCHQMVAEAEEGYALEKLYPFSTKACLMEILAEVAADFLIQLNVNTLKYCESDRCVRYFLDTTKNKSRRWCSMETCGNRIKAKRHYDAHRRNGS